MWIKFDVAEKTAEKREVLMVVLLDNSVTQRYFKVILMKILKTNWNTLSWFLYFSVK